MIRIFFIVLAVLILLSMAGYCVYLYSKLKAQKAVEKALIEQANQAQQLRFARIIDSVEIIAWAMVSDQCGLSEGVLRLKPLLDVIGKKLNQYPNMWALYELVESHPILDERKTLKRNQRMKLDLEREAKEIELEAAIKAECKQLLAAIKE